jgi:hypothetical protein
MDEIQDIMIMLLFFAACFCWYRVGMFHGGNKIAKKLEKDIQYVESMMRAAEMKREYHSAD